jgi:hypothetical protein
MILMTFLMRSPNRKEISKVIREIRTVIGATSVTQYQMSQFPQLIQLV